jgi:glycosyltransferase involved in cell wall biosynthesis
MLDSVHLARNRAVFESLLARLESPLPVADKLRIARQAALMAVETGTGYYSSDILERFYMQLGAANPAPLEEEPVKGTCLLVMTEAYNVGGHTRVAERWIETDRARRYSLALTRPPHVPIPDRLRNAVEASGGEVFVMDKGDLSADGAALRSLSSRFESVLLFVHMYDPLPLVAYGVDAFRRPVGFYNHADHDFWLGVGVADLVVDLRKWGACLTRNVRGATASYTLAIPVDAHRHENPGRDAARARLGLPIDRKLVLTVGSAFKYKPLAGHDFLDAVEPLLGADSAVDLVGIGMTFDDLPGWRCLERRHPGRVKAMGTVPHERLFDYMYAADLLLDSYPVSGPTTLADAVRAGVPILARPGPIGLQDWLDGSKACCPTAKAMTAAAQTLLSNPDLADRHVAALRSRLEAIGGEDVFRSGIDAFFRALLSKEHSLHAFKPRFDGFGDLDAYFLHVNRRSKCRIRLARVLAFFKESDAAGRWRALELLGRRFEYGWRPSVPRSASSK